MTLTFAEVRYKGLINRIAVTMLIFYGLMTVYSTIATAVLPLITSVMPQVAGTVVYELSYGVLYAAVFLLPCLFFKIISKHHPMEPFDIKNKLPRELPLYLFAGIAMVAAAGVLNNIIMSFVELDSMMEDAGVLPSVTTNLEVVLSVFTIAIVPGFVEEMLFRGLILKQLLPYGRTTAVVISALLFGAMHQNPAQFFYATVAGLVFGYIYVRTSSLWCCVLMHFCNNFLSLCYTVIDERLENGTPIILAISLAVYALGLVSCVLMMRGEKRPHGQIFARGAFENSLPNAPEYAPNAIPLARRVRLFFTAPMIVFLALMVLSMVMTVIAMLLLGILI